MQKFALVGNPNSGKTSLFNALTGLKQKVGNFPGVTVDKKEGKWKIKEQSYSLIDLPGIYSLTPKSLDEKVTCEVLLEPEHTDKPDGIILVLDASNLKRNLFLATQVIDLGYPVLVALNMQDIAERRGIRISIEKLSKHLGVPVVSIAAKSKIGLNALAEKLSEMRTKETAFSRIPELEDKQLKELKQLSGSITDFQAFKLSVNAERFEWDKQKVAEFDTWFHQQALDQKALEIQEISLRYETINPVLAEVSKAPSKEEKSHFTDKVDKWVTHPILGTVIFVFVFALLFQAVFTLAVYPMDWIDAGMSALGTSLEELLPSNLVTDFLINGIWAGLAGIVVFVPQIMILFGLVTILEESGYMARVSFLNDRLLRSVGMSGKSVVSLVGGFACAVPAIMAARSIDNWRERLITIMITPLLSCSARLPVYVFLVGFIVPEQFIFGFISLQGLFMLGLYLLGVVMSAVVASILNRILNTKKSGSFFMELPIYRVPKVLSVWNAMWFKGKTFVVEAGKIILVISVILWVLTSFGPSEGMQAVEDKYASLPMTEEVVLEKQSELLQNSYAGILGKQIEPVIEPLGFDWKIGIALIASFAAREVFVGTMSVIYSVEGESNSIEHLKKKLGETINPESGKPLMSIPTAASLLIFYVFAMQCMSTLAIVQRETGTWKWPMIQLVVFTAIAYVSSLLTYQMLT